MATLVLAGAGAALGGAVGGGLAGLGAATLGRAAGAIVGGLLDQRLLGAGGRAVETGAVDRFRLMGAREGAAIPRVYGRMRVPGHVVWASRFSERVDETSGGGKGAPRATTRTHRYSVSLAAALCEGPIEGVGRIWADGREIAPDLAEMRLHLGGEDQPPDPLIEAIEGPGMAPAYRGVAYIVIEDLPLEPFGNRVPQLHVEVFRAPKADPSVSPQIAPPLGSLLRGVALSPGSGEFSLAAVPVRRRLGPGAYASENVNNVEGRPDLLVALDQLERSAPQCRTVSLIVSWFGDDLRCGRCRIAPAVEETEKATEPLSWSVAGISRDAAQAVGRTADGRPVFGGTPSDQTVVQAIRALKARGYRVMFYPFLLMDVPPGSGLVDPYGGAEQAAYPWRGRITLDIAPGRPGGADQSAAAADEVGAFFGIARSADFAAAGETVAYSGPDEWSFRRFILHYAHLCAAAGGVESFVIGSEMRGLTTIRDGAESFPAVAAFRSLAAEARVALGPATAIGYAADWSEYSGYRPDDGSGDVFFHLDPLWADPKIDFVGIDNYLPLSDWRDGHDHADAAQGSLYSLSYLRSGVEGGEHYDWFYASEADRAAQRRTPIRDTAHGEDWVFRVKDIRNWWASAHHDRPGGTRRATPTAWVPMSKPIRFTEIGCPAVDKGANQPNVFVDPKSSESALPHFSTGAEDPEMQRRYLQAMLTYWDDPARNPSSPIYGGPMLDMDAACVWTWDARPWPDFPQRREVWADGANHALGHWITGRVAAAGLAEIVAEICAEAGVTAIDVDGLQGVVDGFWRDGVDTGRQALQPLMMAFGFDAAESGGRLRFASRGVPAAAALEPEAFAVAPDAAGSGLVLAREAAEPEPPAVRVGYLSGSDAYEPSEAEARAGGASGARVERVSLPVALEPGAAQAVADRWLSALGEAAEEARFALPPRWQSLEPGDIVALPTPLGSAAFRIDRAADGPNGREIVARRTDAAPWRAVPAPALRRSPPALPLRAPLTAAILDLPPSPIGIGAAGPHVAVFGAPWPGAAAVWNSADGEDWRLAAHVERPAVMGEVVEPPAAAAPHRWARGAGLTVRLWGGGLASASSRRVFDGVNACALETATGDWEIAQFRGAELIAPMTWRLTDLLRGQAGTEDRIAALRPEGARFLLLDAALTPLAPAHAPLGLERRWRIAPAHLGYGDEACIEFRFTASAASRRPLAPAALRARAEPGGTRFTWLRRDASDADGWGAPADPAPPPGSRWRIAIRVAGATRRIAEASEPTYFYGAADRTADGVSAPYEVAVAEIAALHGPGPEARIVIDD